MPHPHDPRNEGNGWPYWPQKAADEDGEKPVSAEKKPSPRDALFFTVQGPVMHDAGADPASDPIGDGIAEHGAEDRPEQNRKGVQKALLDEPPANSMIAVAGKKRPTRTRDSPKAMKAKIGPAISRCSSRKASMLSFMPAYKLLSATFTRTLSTSAAAGRNSSARLPLAQFLELQKHLSLRSKTSNPPAGAHLHDESGAISQSKTAAGANILGRQDLSLCWRRPRFNRTD